MSLLGRQTFHPGDHGDGAPGKPPPSPVERDRGLVIPDIIGHHNLDHSEPPMADLLAAYRHTTKNRAEIEASSICGCCYCMQSFVPSEIVAYTGLDINNLDDPNAETAETALCPKCGGESVIGDKSGYKINIQFLGLMNEAWFQRTIVHRPSPKK